MRQWSSWKKVLGAAAAALLGSVLLLFAGFRGRGEQSIEKRVGSRRIAKTSANKTLTLERDTKLMEAYGKVPLSFDENVGQTARNVRFMSHGAGYGLFLTSQGAVLTLHHSMAHNLSANHRATYLRALREARRAGTMTVLQMNLEGANPSSRIAGADPLHKRVNYFVGSDPRNWRTDVPSYAQVKYTRVYPGVDLIFYGNQRHLEYDFVVAPGGDPGAIQLALQGAEKIQIGAGGDLVLHVPEGTVTFQKPVVYQTVRGVRQEIAARYSLSRKQRIRFVVGKYDRSEPLIIDPVLNYSTYLGGSVAGDFGGGIAIDSKGDAFVTGATFSVNFPTTTGSFHPGPLTTNANGAVFVTELNPTGTQELYSTYLAGTGDLGDFGFGIAVDGTGKIYVTGMTFSTDFPTSTSGNALKPGPLTSNPSGSSFLTKLDPTASQANQLVYSSYIGGTSGDFGNGIAVDANGNAYIVGETLSSPGTAPGNFPVTAGAFQNTLNSTAGNAFLTRIDTTQATGAASLVYSTYLGGSGAFASTSGLGFAEEALGVAVDSSSNAYLMGTTTSSDFPTTTNGFQTILAPPAAVANGTTFVSRIDTTSGANPQLVYSTYLGGETREFGSAIALGPNNVASVTGSTDSLTYPIVAPTGGVAYQTTGSAAGSAFVSLIDAGKIGTASLIYSTYLGSGGTIGFGIKVDGAGNNYIVGGTNSGAFPIVPGAFQPVFATGAGGEGFLSKLNPGGNGSADLVYSTFFGGSGSTAGLDGLNGIAIDASNDAYVSGTTFSTNLPVFPNPGAFQTSLPSGDVSAAFVAKLTLIPTVVVTPSPFDFGAQPVGATSTPQIFTLTNNTNVAVTFTSIATAGVSPAANTDFAVATDSCSPSVAAGAPCTVAVTFKPGAAASRTSTLTFTDSDSSSPQIVNLSGTGSATAPGVGLAPTSLSFGGQLLTTTSAAKMVTLTNTGTGALTINSIAASGDFAETSTGGTACPISPATLASGANCVTSVTFAPTALGARTGSLTVTDNAGTGTQTVPLTGTGWDFTLTAPATFTVQRGKTANFNVTITPLGGFNQAVALTCTGAVMPVTCLPTTPVTPADGVTPVTSVVTVSTTGLTLVPPSMPMSPMSFRQIVPLLLALSLLFCLFITRRLRTRLRMVTAIAILLALAGCNGSRKVTTTNLTITASSGGVSKTAPVVLTVN